MSDLLIRSTSGCWDLVLGDDGEPILTSDRSQVTRLEQVGQRIVYALMTWTRESPYDRSAGIPYLDGIFGFEPIEGVVSLITQAILDTEGVDGIEEQPTYSLADDVFTVSAKIVVGDGSLDFVLPIDGATFEEAA